MAAGDKVDDLNIKASETNVSETKLGGDVRQILGFKGASTEDVPVWKIHIQLTKPGTWVPLIWGVMCGAAASGHYEWNLDNIGKALLCMTMSGPFLTGYTQTINDWYDREIDAINEPYRPIPSGAISETAVKAQIAVLLLGGLACGWQLDQWCEHVISGDFLVDSVWELGVVYLFRAAVEAESRRLERMLRARKFVHRVAVVGRYGYVWSVDAGRDGVDGVVFHRRFGHRHRERFQIHRRRSSVRFAKFTRRIWG